MKELIKRSIAIYKIKRKKRRDFTESELEKKHVDKSIKYFNDSSYFAGISKEGFSFVTRQSFRVDKPNENWMMIAIPGEGIWGFENKELPEGKGFKQGKLEYICKEPGKQWEIKYQGILPHLIPNDGKDGEFNLNLKWEAKAPIVVFDKIGTTALQVGSQIAKEKWTKEFFKKIKELDQVHYEQAGTFTGTFKWKDKNYNLKFTGVRDHSWGVRNWKDWDRHFWLLGMLDDGRFFNFSLINYTFVKNLQAAFIYNYDKYQTIYKLPTFEKLNLQPMLPKELSFEVQEVKNGPIKKVSIKMKDFFPFRMDNDYYLRQATSVFEYDGVKGIGIAEMGINLKSYDIDIYSTY
jgi:hypothetical protein